MSARYGQKEKGHLRHLRVLGVLVATDPLLVDIQLTRGPAEGELGRCRSWLSHLAVERAVVLHGPVEEIRELVACCITRSHEIRHCWV